MAWPATSEDISGVPDKIGVYWLTSHSTADLPHTQCAILVSGPYAHVLSLVTVEGNGTGNAFLVGQLKRRQQAALLGSS